VKTKNEKELEYGVDIFSHIKVLLVGLYD